MGTRPENLIHVTGFGPFRGFTKSNPSWEAVSLLPDYIIHNGQQISIVKHEIPVTYKAVDQKIKEIWASKPKVSHSICETQLSIFSQLKNNLIEWDFFYPIQNHFNLDQKDSNQNHKVLEL